MMKTKTRSRKVDEGVRRGTHSDHLSGKIENLILAGELKPGEKLDEVRLAAEFGVSRTPVREAIQRLFASGLIENRPRKAVRRAGLDAVSCMHRYSPTSIPEMSYHQRREILISPAVVDYLAVDG